MKNNPNNRSEAAFALAEDLVIMIMIMVFAVAWNTVLGNWAWFDANLAWPLNSEWARLKYWGLCIILSILTLLLIRMVAGLVRHFSKSNR